ncbi:hypothetical protein YWY31_36780 [Paenibacillus illinoisensis]
MSSLLICMLFGVTSVSAQEENFPFDLEKYKVKKSYVDVHQKGILEPENIESSALLIDDASQLEITMTNSKTGERNFGSIEEIETQKIYDLIDKETGEEVAQYKTEIKAVSEHQTSGNASDSSNGMVFYETIYYTVTLDDPGFSYININKIDYRLEIKDSLYKVTEKKMEIQQNGMGISGKTVSNQTKKIDLSNSGTILPRNYGWTAVNVPSPGARVGTITTAKIEVKGSSWDFSFPMNPR